MAGVRPQSLALLAIVAAARTRRVSRDYVVGILWPESPDGRARHALAQAVYRLRRELGADAVISGSTLCLDANVVSTDVDAFDQAVAAKQWAEAASLYAGPFLDGFYLANAPDFDQWADARRATYSAAGARAIDSFAEELREAGRLESAAEQWRRLTLSDPLSARFATAYMEARVALDDRVGVIAYGRAYAARVKEELDAEPDPSVTRLLSQLREIAVNREPVERSPARTDAPISIEPVENVTPSSSTSRRAAQSGWWRVIASMSMPS